ncbi:MAG: PQQ-dependent sugar dehydrogenase [Myxococcaceae bacterium]|nr:PQQ-dependent sugar dehydrogenase [Myxococcaceae bacterium]
MSRQARWTLVAVAAVVVVALLSCQALMRTATKLYPQRYKPQGDPSELKATFAGPDEQRAHLAVKLTRLASGFEQPTTLAFVPGERDTALVLQKTGALKWFDPATGDGGDVVAVNVNTASEQGLLGLAFHPRFVENRRFFLNYTTEKDGKDISRVEEWSAGPAPLRSAQVKPVRVVLEVEQPYANHNGGHLAFGPDGRLYVGFGDGGFKNDPDKAGQNLGTWLGKLLRLDVDAVEHGRGYSVPADNPFVSRAGARPEVWAYGLRNPWRYAFAPDGRLVVADVGQDAWEEVGFAAKGDNLGWSVREGRHCFEPREACATAGLREPFFEYGHDEGQSVTGGVVVTGARVPALAGKYVFGDFILGKLWALDLPGDGDALVQPASLGKWPVLPVSFALDEAGDLYVLDFAGAVLRVDPP